MTEGNQRVSSLQVRDTRVFAYIAELQKVQSFPPEIREIIVAQITEKIRYILDWETAEMISTSEMVPKEYLNKPNNVFVAIQKGRTLGLSPFQSVEHLSNVNGKTKVYGDMMKALAENDPRYIDCVESRGDLVETDNHGLMPEWTECRVKIRDRDDVVHRYTLEEAKLNPNYNSSSWKKKNVKGQDEWVEHPGVWMRYGPRMMQFRSRSFALRDAFPGRLAGVYDEYESVDISEAKDITDKVQDLGPQSASETLKSKLAKEQPYETPVDPIDKRVDEPEQDPEKKSEPSDEPREEKEPENLSQIKEDFKQWAKNKAITKDSYEKYIELGSLGKWTELVTFYASIHSNLSAGESGKQKNEEVPQKPDESQEKPCSNEFVNKLKKIVDDPDFKSIINELLLEGKIKRPDNNQNILRTQDEKEAKEVYKKIMERKGFHDNENKQTGDE